MILSLPTPFINKGIRYKENSFGWHKKHSISYWDKSIAYYEIVKESCLFPIKIFFQIIKNLLTIIAVSYWQSIKKFIF